MLSTKKGLKKDRQKKDANDMFHCNGEKGVSNALT